MGKKIKNIKGGGRFTYELIESIRSSSVPECTEHKREREEYLLQFKSESLKVIIEKEEVKEKQTFDRGEIVSSLCMSSSKCDNSHEFEDEEEDTDLDKFPPERTYIYINRTSVLERGCPVEKIVFKCAEQIVLKPEG